MNSPQSQPQLIADGMVIDCSQCLMADTLACRDCIVPLLAPPTAPLVLHPIEQKALSNLAAEGLAPQVRMLSVTPPS